MCRAVHPVRQVAVARRARTRTAGAVRPVATSLARRVALLMLRAAVRQVRHALTMPLRPRAARPGLRVSVLAAQRAS